MARMQDGTLWLQYVRKNKVNLRSLMAWLTCPKFLCLGCGYIFWKTAMPETNARTSPVHQTSPTSPSPTPRSTGASLTKKGLEQERFSDAGQEPGAHSGPATQSKRVVKRAEARHRDSVLSTNSLASQKRKKVMESTVPNYFTRRTCGASAGGTR